MNILISLHKPQMDLCVLMAVYSSDAHAHAISA